MILMFIVGIFFLTYPYICNFINTYFQEKDIKQYLYSTYKISYETQNEF